MWLSCIPSKNLATEPMASPESVVPVVPVESSVKKVSCNCVACAPVTCLPLWKSSQPLVLRSTPPSESEKLTSVAGVSAPDAEPVKAPATEAVSLVSQ